ncbi:hypothetical protein RHORCCE3_1812 [Rickettsia hoogstraalii str. RCCE3]|nr:hypothetical protein RHORCCE3_1812 [Rickettsia hoogstraalii str. RCCE3]
MEEELAYNFLYFPDKFIEQFQRVLDRTPHERAPSQQNFWTHFFLGSSVTIQNSDIGNNIQDICFSIGASKNAKIVKLAFKVEIDNKEKVILRSISISKDDAISEDVRYSKNELKTIASKFWGRRPKRLPTLLSIYQMLILKRYT